MVSSERKPRHPFAPTEMWMAVHKSSMKIFVVHNDCGVRGFVANGGGFTGNVEKLTLFFPMIGLSAVHVSKSLLMILAIMI